MTSVTSRQNIWFKRFRAAAAKHDREVIVEGEKQVADLLAAGIAPIAIALSGERSLAAPHASAILQFSPDLIAALSATETAQGIIALIERPRRELDDLEVGRKPIVVLDGVQDPGNVGTIIRLAVAFDAAAVITTEGCADPWSPKVIRAAAGSVFGVPVVESDIDAVLAFAASLALPLYATALEGEKDLSRIEHRSLIFFGSEGRGVSEKVLEQSRHVTIAMSRRVESLNVATAAAIVLARIYERR